MDRADDIVEVARLQQAGHAILSAGNEVSLDPQPQVGLLTHEPAVLVEVIAGELSPERVLPHGQRLLKAVHVLRNPELNDPTLACHRPVALDVGRSEVPLGGRARLVGSKMQVIVGEHRPAIQAVRARSSISAMRRSSGVVTFRFSLDDRTTPTLPPARCTNQASSVASTSTSSGTSSARSRAPRRKTCGVCTAHSLLRSSVSLTNPFVTRLTVSVIGTAAIAPSIVSSSSSALIVACANATVRSGRAASWTSTRS